MQPNPTLKKLGFSDGDRVVILHADDIGMCQAALDAYADLIDFGLIASAAVMVPCPWFPATAAFCRAHPGLDMGVHVTITSEWDTYRWGPISTREAASGLLDEEGYFYRSSKGAQRADPAAVEVEINAQIDRALAAGIDVTHADDHMGTVFHDRFVLHYVQAALSHGLPPLIPRWDKARFRKGLGLNARSAEEAAAYVQQLEAQGVPLVDHFAMFPLSDVPEDPVARAKAAMAALRPGLTHYILHPARETPEIRAIAPDWRARVANYAAFTSEDVRAFIKAEGIHVIGYRPLRDLLRAAVGAGR